MTLAWRTSLALCFPCSLVLVACPGDDGPARSDDDSSTSSAEDSTTASTPDPSTESTSTSTGEPPAMETGSSDSTTSASTSSGPMETSAASSEIAVCGNNEIEGDEVCDLHQLNGETCVSLGYQGGMLGCMLTCKDYNLLGCFICGNEVIDVGEDCEGGEVPEEITCVGLGYEAGTVACGDDCLWDTSECSICGDGIQQGPENCDGIDFGGETCMSLGFDMGTLACVQSSCAFDYSGCEGGLYFQDFEIGLVPPEFTVGGTQPFVVDTDNAIAGMYSAHSGAISHNQTSSMSISANFGVAGDISFWHEESTEPCCDHLEFYIDGVMVQDWSGTNAAAMASFPVAAGIHDFEWRYDKDGSVNTGSDRVWVDDITMTPGVPI